MVKRLSFEKRPGPQPPKRKIEDSIETIAWNERGHGTSPSSENMRKQAMVYSARTV